MVFLQLSNPQHSAELWDIYGGLILSFHHGGEIVWGTPGALGNALFHSFSFPAVAKIVT